jgi:hypothetical protein
MVVSLSRGTVLIAISALAASASPLGLHTGSRSHGHGLAGAWRAKVEFADGPYAAVKDLKFLFTFNKGGRLMESSNYDAAPPVTPAYGIWRKVGTRKYELRYEFFNTKPPKRSEDLPGGWLPAGWGVIKETVTLAPKGNTYTSKLLFVLKDDKGNIVPGSGKATSISERMAF